MSDDALECALRALRHRDRTEHEIDELLLSNGFSNEESADAIGRLVRTGVVSDERFAEARATSLAARGEGDALIRRRLVAAGNEQRRAPRIAQTVPCIAVVGSWSVRAVSWCAVEPPRRLPGTCSERGSRRRSSRSPLRTTSTAG